MSDYDVDEVVPRAETAASSAETSANNAATSAATAYHWAEYPEDQPVPEGDGNEYSAYHWAMKALENAIGFPPGTRMLFYQAAPPPGWSILNINIGSDGFLHVTSSWSEGVQGVHNPLLCDVVASHSHIATAATAGGHKHTFDYPQYWSASGSDDRSMGTTPGSTTQRNLDSTIQTAGDHSHTITVQANAGTNWQPRYYDIIIGELNAI
jgi:hypothetical protein